MSFGKSCKRQFTKIPQTTMPCLYIAGMKISLSFWLLFLSFQLLAQTSDSIQLINFFGTYAPSINNEVKTYRQIKPLMKAYPETFAAWKKARNAERIGQLLLLTDAVATFVLLLSDNEAVMLGSLGIGLGALTTFILYEDIRNVRLKHAVQLYNRRLSEDQVKQLSPR